MRKLRKSYSESTVFIVRAKHRTNKSPKRFNRLMHCIHDITNGFEPNPFKHDARADLARLSRADHARLSRAELRAALFSPTLPVLSAPVTPEPRKLTGAVRRGLAKGKQA